MSKLLYIKGNPQIEEKSSSLKIGKVFLDDYKRANPNDEVIEIDLYEEYIPIIDKDILNAWEKLEKDVDFSELSELQKKKVRRFNELTEQFIGADKYVFATPIWNFSIPPLVKAYIDTICVAGKTFKYTEQGPVGLLNSKKLLHIQSSGSVFSEGPAASTDHGASYIKVIANFIGIEEMNTFYIEGMDQYPDMSEEIFNKAQEGISAVAKKF